MIFGFMITICDINGIVKYQTPINEGCRRKFELMKEDSVLLKFSLVTPIRFVCGDYIDISPTNYNFVTHFVLAEDYKPRFNNTT